MKHVTNQKVPFLGMIFVDIYLFTGPFSALVPYHGAVVKTLVLDAADAGYDSVT